MEEILHRFNPWWEKKYELPGTPRVRYLSLLEKLESTRDVIFITGLRRVGKTTLMHQYIHGLLEKVDPRLIFYVSLDNLALEDQNILEVVDTFRRITSCKHDDDVFLFLDEVHFKEDFELQLKNLYDLGHAKIIASGSASLDIVMRSPHLTGRQRIMPIHPLSFGEYLKFTGQDIGGADMHLYPALAHEYVLIGGMPEYVRTRDPNNLQSLLDSILFRDIAGKHELRNREALKDILLFTAQSVSTPASIRKISRVLEIKEKTVKRIFDLLVESGLVHQVEREGKLPERKASARKLYLADTSLFTVLTENINLGAVVENLIYITLAKTSRVRYHRSNGKEIDFITDKSIVESKYKSDITQADMANLANLVNPTKTANQLDKKGAKWLSSKTRQIITKDTQGEIEGIELIPLWKFLLDREE